MAKTGFIFSVIAGLIFGFSSEADAKKGFYLGLGVPYTAIQGDFDGSSGLENGTEIIILPEIDASIGLGILFGYGISQKWAVELNFLGSTHDGNWMGLTGDVDYFNYSINGKYNFSSSEATQPYLMFGISSNVLVILDGSQVISSGEVGDATLSGPGFNVGGGVEHYFKNLSMRFGFTYRFVSYNDAEGVHGEGGIDDSVDGSGYGLMLSTAYHF